MPRMQHLRLSPDRVTPGHAIFRDAVQRFVAQEIEPHAGAWDEAGGFPRELYRRAAAVGLYGMGLPELHGGTPEADSMHALIAGIELAQCGAGGVVASLMSQCIAAPPIAALGSAELQSRTLPRILSGEWIGALAITEPGGGSDVAALRTAARRDGDCYVVNGEKTFITSGVRADLYTVAVRTDPAAQGARGISLLVIPRDTAGFTRTPLDKMGWWASDTAHLRFEDARVPVANLLGRGGRGLPRDHAQLHRREVFDGRRCARVRLGLLPRGARMGAAAPHVRAAAGRPPGGAASLRRHAGRDRSHAGAARGRRLAPRSRAAGSAEVVASVCMAKNTATRTLQSCADAAVQTLGGMGYMRGSKSERIYREVKVNMIGGGAEEIMKDLAARQLGW